MTSITSSTFKHPIQWEASSCFPAPIRHINELSVDKLLEDLDPKWLRGDANLEHAIRDACQNHAPTAGLQWAKESLRRCQTMRLWPGYTEEDHTSDFCTTWLRYLNEPRGLRRYRFSDAEDDVHWLKLGAARCKMFTTRTACAFPSEEEYPARFPIAAILPQTKDLYEPRPAKWTSEVRSHWQSWRRKSSKSLEQIAVLVAMAQYQTQVLNVKRFQVEDPRLDIFESFLIVPKDTRVQIIRARIPRQVLDAFNNISWSQKLRKLPQDVCIRIERSVYLDTRRDDELLKLLSAMEAMLRRYDDMKLLFAKRNAPIKEALSHQEKHASSHTRPHSDSEPGSSPERGRLRTRRGDPLQPNQAFSASQKLPSDSSREKSTHSNTASSQERRTMSNSKQDLPHSIGTVHSTPANRVSTPHSKQAGAAARGLSQATGSPQMEPKKTVRPEGSMLSQEPRLSSASSPQPARRPQAQPRSTSQSSFGSSR